MSANGVFVDIAGTLNQMVSSADSNRILVTLEYSHSNGRDFRREAMRLLSDLDGYDWCGVYRLEGATLVLDEYLGKPTEHTHIPVGAGVCGTAVALNKNQTVPDVRKLENYLACSLETRSEIVVLIHRDGVILGQIDIDGHTVGTFDRGDEKFLEQVAELIADRWTF